MSLLAASGFVLYGGRLFLMLRRFPIESRGRKKKLQEVLASPLSPPSTPTAPALPLLPSLLSDNPLARRLAL